MEETESFFVRHSMRDEEDGELSPEGFERAKEFAKEELVRVLENTEEGSVIFMAGNSAELRTRSTLEVYADELKSKLDSRGDYLFFSRDEIKIKQAMVILIPLENYRN